VPGVSGEVMCYTHPSLGLQLMEVASRVSVAGGTSLPQSTSYCHVRRPGHTQWQQVGGQQNKERVTSAPSVGTGLWPVLLTDRHPHTSRHLHHHTHSLTSSNTFTYKVSFYKVSFSRINRFVHKHFSDSCLV